jgi:hypothetical protein
MVTKNHILEEIGRTAEQNGGKPLGSQKFRSETGIRKYDWEKYWARWGDAIKEAGFAPNQLQGAYESRELLNKYASLARELGRLPTSNDLRFRAHNDPTFPSPSTFSDRFRKKEDIVRHLLEYCRACEEYADVVRMCEGYTPSHRVVASEEATAQNGDKLDGFVYLMKSGRFYKIGRTNAAGRREYELSIQLPESTKTIHVIRTDDPNGIEEYWHHRFKAKRRGGEWFHLNAADVAAFRRRKFM